MTDVTAKRILIVDSNPAIHEDFKKLFSQTETLYRGLKKSNIPPLFIVDSAYDVEEAIRYVERSVQEQNLYTISFMDLHLNANSEVITAVKRIWEVDPDLQMVFSNAYSAYSWQDLIQELHRPDHFIILNKPFDINEIRQLVFYLFKSKENDARIKEHIHSLDEKIKYLYTHDQLTGFSHLTEINELLLRAVTRSEQERGRLGVILFSIGHLKEIQAVLGCSVVEELIKKIAETLQSKCSSVDTFIRKSTDELMIILSNQLSEKNILEKAEELHAEFAHPLLIGQHSVFVQMYAGVFSTREGTDADTLIKKAEAALIYSKLPGKKTVQFYDKTCHDAMLRRAELMLLLPHALKQSQFVLHYQPLVKANSSQILGLEALIRWQHPVLGLLYPPEFITLAEEMGLIGEIGEWVFKTAFSRVKKWQETIAPDLVITINISSYQLCQSNFEGLIQKSLKKAELLPRCLELELIANPLLMENQDVLQKMIRLKEMGVRFALNNFGTRFANLDYLQSFPFDKIKIDRSFVKQIQSNSKESKAIEAIIYFAKKMGVQVVVEGIETQVQVEFLFNHHGEQMQGYYFSPPLNEDACTVLLEKQSSHIKEEG